METGDLQPKHSQHGNTTRPTLPYQNGVVLEEDEGIILCYFKDRGPPWADGQFVCWLVNQHEPHYTAGIYEINEARARHLFRLRLKSIALPTKG